MSDVYVVGIDMIKFMKAGTGPAVEQLGATAALMALDDCGLKIQDMEALYCGNLGQAGGMVGQRVLQQIGQTGIPVVNTANACATGATAFREAWMAIKAGVYDVVIAVGVEKMGAGLLGGAGGATGRPKEGLLGSMMPAVFVRLRSTHAVPGTTFSVREGVVATTTTRYEPEGDTRSETPLGG
jgi:acetyl-CoA acetyltransferase